MTGTIDTEVRVQLYHDFVLTGRAPSTNRIAEALGIAEEDVRAATERLAAGKAIVLQPYSREVLMANPLCAVPTPYVVRAIERLFFGSCVWDAMGIIAMLKAEATLETSCPCCGEAMAIAVRDNQPVSPDGIIHFGLPARRWWENIVFT